MEFANIVDCEPSLYFVISGPGMEDYSVWPCGVMQVRAPAHGEGLGLPPPPPPHTHTHTHFIELLTRKRFR